MEKLDLDQIVNNLAARMRNIQIAGKSLGSEAARQRILRWIENFEGLLTDTRPCLKVLERIEVLEDRAILERCLGFLEEHCDFKRRHCNLTCFGSQYESSARIIRAINSHPGYVPDPEDLCISQDPGEDQEPLIIFIDDFLNSGGQFISILRTWFEGEAEPSDPRKRRALPRHVAERLKRAWILFLFDKCMEEGRRRAEKAIQQFGLKGEIRCMGTYRDSEGLFGGEKDLAAIRAGLPDRLDNSPVFTGWSCADVTDFLAVCEQAGEALLRLNKPDWPEERYGERCLGYGNSAKLYFTEANVPTCTLTCMWLGGEITVKGKRVQWEPLIPRRGKKEAGVEGRVEIRDDTSTKWEPDLSSEEAVKLRQRALAWPVGTGCEEPVPGEFHTKLVYRLRLNPAALELGLPGWQRVTLVEDAAGFFSEWDVDCDSQLPHLTSDALTWLPTAEGGELPAVYRLDLQLLRNRKWILAPAGNPLELVQVDLVPLQAGAACALGFWFAGRQPCSASDYLDWIGQRSYSRLALHDRQADRIHPDHEKPVATHLLGGVVAELINAAQQGRLPRGEAMTEYASLRSSPHVVQFLLSPAGEWPEPDKERAAELAWHLVTTLSRNKPSYPKVGISGVADWCHEEALDTRYGLSAKALTAWADAGDRFNATTKPRLMMEPYYLMWLLAKELARANADRTQVERIARSYRGSLRPAFFRWAWSTLGAAGPS
jgi:hypothetical protein